ncbi:hypothetical protein GCM10027088_62060 [Nocardia goodfellowii]
MVWRQRGSARDGDYWHGVGTAGQHRGEFAVRRLVVDAALSGEHQVGTGQVPVELEQVEEELGAGGDRAAEQ